MSGHCKHCGYDGCVCDDEERTNRNVSRLLPHEKAYLKKLVTHTPDKCKGRHCCIHNPSDHHMRKWLMNYRQDKGMMERICPEHGVGHPDPDDLDYWVSIDKELRWVSMVAVDAVKIKLVMTYKSCLMTDRSHKTKQSRLKYNTITKRNNE
jgi:hypothetical protein